MTKKSTVIIFDFDGVLINSKEAYLRQMQETIYKLAEKIIAEDILREKNGNADQLEVFSEFLETEEPEKLQEAKVIYDALTPKYESMRKVFPGVLDVLEELYKSHNLAIVSRKAQKRLEYWVKHFDLSKYFKIIIGTLEPTKAHAINKVVEEFNADKKKTLFVGDTPFDITSGKEAGVKVVAALYGAENPEELLSLKPDYKINDIKEILDIVAKLENYKA